MKNTHSLCQVTLDLATLQANYAAIRAVAEGLAPPVWCHGARRAAHICVVKADAYGHGMPECAQALARTGAKHFAVATAGEALALRALLPQAEILVLSPVEAADAPILAEAKITVTAGSEEELRALAAAVRRAVARRDLPKATTIACHAKIDTGMHRLGFASATIHEARHTVYALRSLSTLPGLHLCGIYTHPASADDRGSSQTAEQAHAFCRVRSMLGARYRYHFSNSAAALSLGTLGMDHYRVGIALYGLSPAPDFLLPPGLHLRPVARMQTRLTRVFTARAGEKIGYGGAFIARRTTRVGVAAVGYADGLPRRAEGAALLVGGRAARIIGHVCMDQCMLDLGSIPACAGTPVTVFDPDGRQITALAKQSGTIPYELLCHLSTRAARTYLPGL